jgi:hypothetical protein
VGAAAAGGGLRRSARRSPLGEWLDAAPAERISAKAIGVRPGGHGPHRPSRATVGHELVFPCRSVVGLTAQRGRLSQPHSASPRAAIKVVDGPDSPEKELWPLCPIVACHDRTECDGLIGQVKGSPTADARSNHHGSPNDGMRDRGACQGSSKERARGPRSLTFGASQYSCIAAMPG